MPAIRTMNARAIAHQEAGVRVKWSLQAEIDRLEIFEYIAARQWPPADKAD
jgi:hypothetical protein